MRAAEARSFRSIFLCVYGTRTIAGAPSPGMAGISKERVSTVNSLNHFGVLPDQKSSCDWTATCPLRCSALVLERICFVWADG